MENREAPPASGDESPGYLFEQFRVPRGCLGYLIADSETNLAAIVDPELEMVEPMIDFVFKHGLRPAYIVDTHTHADHVSGARKLKAKTIAKLVMHEKAPSSAMDIQVEDGDRLRLGSLPLKFFYTPGHAKDLVSILLPGRILSGDALLIGSCGRTDLLNGQRRQAVPYPLPHLQEPPRRPRGLARPRLQGPQPLYCWATRSRTTQRCSSTPRRSSSSSWTSRIPSGSTRSSTSRRRSRRT